MNLSKVFRLTPSCAALGLALVLSGCFGEEYIGEPTPPVVDPDPVNPSNPCADDASLCLSRQVLIDTGIVAFANNCVGCHGDNGEGSRGPALANSDFFMNHRQGVIHLILRGNGEDPQYYPTLVVNGVEYTGGGMPAWHEVLSNAQLAGILTYFRSVKNDSTISNCAGDPPTCTKTARNPADMLVDTVAVWEVKAVRDSLIASGKLTPL